MKYPTKNQKQALLNYVKNDGDFSIYGKDGIYEKLENEIKKRYGVKYCLLTNTGTSALSSAYFGLNLKENDEVIVPAYTFCATVTPLQRLKCQIVYADTDAHTGQIDVEHVQDLITKETKAIVVTHMWGISCDMYKLVRLCNLYNVKLIEDCSHAHFTKFNNELLGTFGDVACFSCGAKKIVSGGEGGFLITNDEEIYVRATLLGHFVKRAEDTIAEASKKMKVKYQHLTSGFGENYRMHPYSAVMINALIKNEIDNIVEHRYKVYFKFAKEIKKIKRLEIHSIYKGAIYGFKPKLLKGDLDEFIKKVKKHGVKIKSPDTKPMKMLAGAKKYMQGRFSVSDFTTGDLEKDLKTVDNYIKIFKKCLK